MAKSGPEPSPGRRLPPAACAEKGKQQVRTRSHGNERGRKRHHGPLRCVCSYDRGRRPTCGMLEKWPTGRRYAIKRPKTPMSVQTRVANFCATRCVGWASARIVPLFRRFVRLRRKRRCSGMCRVLSSFRNFQCCANSRIRNFGGPSKCHDRNVSAAVACPDVVEQLLRGSRFGPDSARTCRGGPTCLADVGRIRRKFGNVRPMLANGLDIHSFPGGLWRK